MPKINLLFHHPVISSVPLLLCLLIQSTLANHDPQISPDDDTSTEHWIFALLIFTLPLVSGFFSIILVAFLSIDELVLELKLKTGTLEEKIQVFFHELIFVG